MVAGEVSGDILGADFISHLKGYFPQAQFEGIGGAQMKAEGFTSFFPLERLSVMGFIEPLNAYLNYCTSEKRVIQHFLKILLMCLLGLMRRILISRSKNG